MSGRIDRKWVDPRPGRGGDRRLLRLPGPAAAASTSTRSIEDLSQSLGSWTYLLVGALAFLETGAFVGLVAPGEFTVMLGGAVASQGDISLPLIIAVTWICGLRGGFGELHARRAALGVGSWSGTGAASGSRQSAWSRSRPISPATAGRTILIGRFIGLVRALAPFIAGSSKLRYRAFAPYSILGTGLWSIALILLGYFFARSLDKVTKHRRQGPAGLRDRRRGRRGLSSWPTGSCASRRTGARWWPRWRSGAPSGRSCALGRRLRPRVRVPRAAADAGRAGPRVHDPAGGALGRAVRPDRLLVGDRWGSGADAGGPDRLRMSPTTCRRTGSWTARRWSPDSAPAGWSIRWARSWRSSWRSAGAGWSSGPWSCGTVLIAVLVPEIKTWTDRPRPAGPARLRRAARLSRAVTPPRRRSTPGSR